MIYRFIDTADRTPRADIPAEALNINGQYLEDIVPGYRTLTVTGRESMSAEVNTLEGGRADGVNYNFKRYPERVITIGFQLLADTPEDFRRAFNALGGALNCEQVKLIFNDELDKYFVGTPGEIEEIEPGKNKVVGQFNIVCSDPFKYSCTEYHTDVQGDTIKKILYNGTVPSFPRMVANNTSGSTWFQRYQIDDNMLVVAQEGNGMTKVGNMSDFTTTTSSPWTINTATTTGELERYQIIGKLRYEPSSAQNIFRFDIYGDTGDVGLTPRIRVIRNYSDGLPLTEVQFMVGSDIVYRQTIDDDNGDNRFPFRVSFSHSGVLQSVKLGRMTGNYYFQFRDIVYEYRKSWNYTVSSDATAYTISGAKFEASSHYMDSMPSRWNNTIMNLYNNSFESAGSVFPSADATLVYPETGEILVNELPVPQWGNPANRWEKFKLQPGENTLKCGAYGAGSGSLVVRFYWREVFV